MKTIITKEQIKFAENASACKSALVWLKEKERTFEELKEHNIDWYIWALEINVPDCPINLKGLSPSGKAWVMASREDCPIDFSGMGSYDKARVMASRKDCPIDLSGMGSYDKARVMANRKDCPIDLEGLYPSDRAWVISKRPDYNQ